jgi:proton-translocating NADH-quinone oxidoreductase chain N
VFVTDAMEILFAGAMASLLVDIGARRYGKWRPQVAGGLASAAILASLVLLLENWGAFPGTSMTTQPESSPLASLYVADQYTVFVAFTAMVIVGLVSVYSWRYLTAADNVGPFNSLLLLLLCSVLGVASAGDLLTLFLFWEAMSLSAFGLVSFRKNAELSLEATLKYFFLAGVGSLLSLYGIGVLYAVSGSIRFTAVTAASASQLGLFGIVFLVLGFGVEAAIVPLHTWLPDVYSASPAPAAAAVSGVVTGTGVFALLKVLQPLAGALGGEVQSLQAALVGLALLTMLLGNLAALRQTNLKRMLGYSSVAQTGYMLAALSTLTPAGFVAVVFTIWNHGLLKSNFFMLAGRDDSKYESTELGALGGLGRSDPRLGLMYASSSLAMVGSPPFGLFWSEILIVQALLAASSATFFWLAVAVTLNVVLSIGYYYPVINRVVFGEGGQARRATAGEIAVPLALLALSVLTGLVPGLLLARLA